MDRSAPDRVSRACLRCYAPLAGEARGPSEVCPRCGFVNLKVDRAAYWTREPLFVRAEWLLKAAAVAVTFLLVWTATFSLPHGGTGAGWFLLIPVAFGAALWMTASGLTRRTAYFRAALVWSVSALLLGALALLVLPFLVGLAFAAVCVAAAFGIGVFARALERWKRGRVARGLARARSEGAAA